MSESDDSVGRITRDSLEEAFPRFAERYGQSSSVHADEGRLCGGRACCGFDRIVILSGQEDWTEAFHDPWKSDISDP